MRATPFIALGVLAGLALPGWAGAAPKVHVVPYAPVYKQLPAELGVKTAALLSEELAAQKKVELVAGPEASAKAAAGSPKERAQAVGRAERLAVKADEAVHALKFDEAIGLYQASLETYEQNLEYVTDYRWVVDVHLQLAAALFRQQREADGERVLAAVIRLAPERELDAARYPPLFIRTHDGIRKKLLRLPRGAASVITNPPGAAVYLNGRQVGKAPILLKELVRGRHYLRVEAPGVAPWARLVEVSPTKVEQVEVSLGGGIKGPAGPLVDALSRNSLDAGVLAHAALLAKKVGADFLVFGALAKDAEAYQVRSFLYDAATGKVAALSQVAFDFELLGAAIEVYRIAGEVGAGVATFPAEGPLPLKLFDGVTQDGASALTEVVAGPQVPQEAPIQPGAVTEVAAGTPAKGSEKDGPVVPLAPLIPEDDPAPVRREPTGPLAAGPIRVDGDEAPESNAAPRPNGPIGPITAATPVTPSAGGAEEASTEERKVVAVGGPRARLLDSELSSGQRFAAVDVDEIVIPKDEIQQEKRWPWWAWGLLAVGVVGVGAGGYFAAQETGLLGSSASDATVVITW